MTRYLNKADYWLSFIAMAGLFLMLFWVWVETV